MASSHLGTTISTDPPAAHDRRPEAILVINHQVRQTERELDDDWN